MTLKVQALHPSMCSITSRTRRCISPAVYFSMGVTPCPFSNSSRRAVLSHSSVCSISQSGFLPSATSRSNSSRHSFLRLLIGFLLLLAAHLLVFRRSLLVTTLFSRGRIIENQSVGLRKFAKPTGEAILPDPLKSPAACRNLCVRDALFLLPFWESHSMLLFSY